MSRHTNQVESPARLLLSTRWIFGHLLALGLVVAFIFFGFWQLDRLEQTRAENAVRVSREAQEPLVIGGGSESSELLLDADAGQELDLRRGTATGVYAPEDELLLRSRALNGQPGRHVLTPLTLADGSRLLVDRGRVPYDHDTVPVRDAPPPEGTVTVSGVLRSSERPPEGALASFAPRNPSGTDYLAATWYVDLERLAVSQLPGLLQGAWLLLEEEQPARSGELPIPGTLPEMDEGPHFGYALQWFSFAAVGIIGYAFLMRKVLHDNANPPATAD